MNVTLYFSFFVLHCIVSNICKCSKGKAYIVNKNNNRVKKKQKQTNKKQQYNLWYYELSSAEFNENIRLKNR